LGQIDSQQPATTYAEFKHEILNEIARALNLPYNVAVGNSAGYNYASGRLDHQTYYKSIRVEQAHLAEIVLDQIFNAWIREAMLTPEFAVLRTLRSMPTLSGCPLPLQKGWFFDGTEHVDPAKEANAQAKRLSSHTTTLAAEYARQGKDWETELRQRAKETKLMQTLGLTVSESQPNQSSSSSSSNSQENNVHDDDTVANTATA
jgi:capsid protein